MRHAKLMGRQSIQVVTCPSFGLSLSLVVSSAANTLKLQPLRLAG